MCATNNTNFYESFLGRSVDTVRALCRRTSSVPSEVVTVRTNFCNVLLQYDDDALGFVVVINS